MNAHTGKKALTLTGTVAALGIVFGDIGTSPLYALSLIFSPSAEHHVMVSEANVLGLLSTIFWLVTLVVTIKYASFILRADNHGEGGTVALVSLLREKLTRRRTLTVVTVIGFAGMALFLGDAVITPAISVLSAVEGITVLAPGYGPYVVPTVLVILLALFIVQRSGTARIGRLFGPTMAVWFTVLAVMGVCQIAQNPGVLRGVNPMWAIEFIAEQPLLFFVVLSILLLTVTGVEALYADLGHFGRPAIFSAWIAVAFPALMLNYFGQGALILRTPNVENLFFSMVPSALVLPLVALSTVATVIAAQAVISGAFSLVAQATKLSYLPRIQLRYPSGEHGQVYVPAVNWLLLVVVAAIVIAFESSEALADAYGISVVACMLVETALFYVFVRQVWRKPRWLTVPAFVVFIVVDVALLVSCLPKISSGGWFPLLLAFLVFTLFMTWHTARTYLNEKRAENEGDLSTFVASVNENRTTRLPGTAIYLHPHDRTVPISMRAVRDRFGAVHTHTLIVSVHIADVPVVSPTHRASINNLGYEDGIWHVTLNFGFNEKTDVPTTLAAAIHANRKHMPGVCIDNATYFVSKFETDHAHIPHLAKPLERLFVAMKDSETDPIPFYKLPLDSTISIGTHLV